MKRWTVLAFLAVLCLSGCQAGKKALPSYQESLEALGVFTLDGSDRCYGPLTKDHNTLKALGVMDPNATVWSEPALTAEDLGETVGTVGWSGNEDDIGCAVYRWAKYPEAKALCILDAHGAYRLCWENGTIHPSNGTGIPVEKTAEEVLAAPGIPWENRELPENVREIFADLNGDGEEERLLMPRESVPVYGDPMGTGDWPLWLCDPLWVVTEEKDGTFSAMEFPASAFLAALEELLELEFINGQTLLYLEGEMINPTALLKKWDGAPVLKAGLADPWIVDGSKAGYMSFSAGVRIKTKRTVHTVGSFGGRIGYEDGVFTLSDWELYCFPLD